MVQQDPPLTQGEIAEFLTQPRWRFMFGDTPRLLRDYSDNTWQVYLGEDYTDLGDTITNLQDMLNLLTLLQED